MTCPWTLPRYASVPNDDVGVVDAELLATRVRFSLCDEVGLDAGAPVGRGV